MYILESDDTYLTETQENTFYQKNKYIYDLVAILTEVKESYQTVPTVVRLYVTTCE